MVSEEFHCILGEAGVGGSQCVLRRRLNVSGVIYSGGIMLGNFSECWRSLVLGVFNASWGPGTGVFLIF